MTIWIECAAAGTPADPAPLVPLQHHPLKGNLFPTSRTSEVGWFRCFHCPALAAARVTVSGRDLPSHSLPSTVRYLDRGGSPSLWPKEEPSIRFSSRHIRSSRQTQTRISSSWADRSGGVLLVARFPIKLVSHRTTSISELATPARHARPRIHLSKCSDTRLHAKRLRGVFDPGSLSCWTLPATPTTVALWKLGVSLREAGSELPRMRQIESHRFEDTHRRATGCNYALPPASGRPCCLSRSRAIRSPVG